MPASERFVWASITLSTIVSGIALIAMIDRGRQHDLGFQIHDVLRLVRRWVRPSFIFPMRLSGSVGDIHSSFDTRLSFRLRSKRRSSSSVGFSTPSCSCSRRRRYSFQSSPVSRRTIDFMAALASSVVESTATVLPLISPFSAANFSTH